MSADDIYSQMAVDISDPDRAAECVAAGLLPLIELIGKKHPERGTLDFFGTLIGEIAGYSLEAFGKSPTVAMLVLISANVVEAETVNSQEVH